MLLIVPQGEVLTVLSCNITNKNLSYNSISQKENIFLGQIKTACFKGFKPYILPWR
jgi:hypothetical protein